MSTVNRITLDMAIMDTMTEEEFLHKLASYAATFVDADDSIDQMSREDFCAYLHDSITGHLEKYAEKQQKLVASRPGNKYDS